MATAQSRPPKVSTASATAEESAELAGERHDAYLSSNRTCEIGLSRATGHTYESVINALDRATRD